jgi:hypothetical protein
MPGASLVPSFREKRRKQLEPLATVQQNSPDKAVPPTKAFNDADTM